MLFYSTIRVRGHEAPRRPRRVTRPWDRAKLRFGLAGPISSFNTFFFCDKRAALSSLRGRGRGHGGAADTSHCPSLLHRAGLGFQEEVSQAVSLELAGSLDTSRHQVTANSSDMIIIITIFRGFLSVSASAPTRAAPSSRPRPA